MSAAGRRGRAVVTMLVALAGVGCDRPAPPRLYLMWVDVSASMRHHEACRDAWGRLTTEGALRPGDRVILARITAATTEEFRPVVDVSLPRLDPVLGVRRVHAQALARSRDTLLSALDRALAGPRQGRTAILQALGVSARLLRADGRPGTILICSDMLEDTALLDLDRVRPSRALGGAVARRLAAAGRLPNLTGAEIRVVGGTGSAAGSADDVEAFWRELLCSMGVTLQPEHYGAWLLRLDDPAGSRGPGRPSCPVTIRPSLSSP